MMMRPALSTVTAAVLLLATGGSAAAQQSATQGPAIDLAARPDAVKKVADAYRPSFRWWWPRCGVSQEQIREDLQAIKNAGFGGAEQVLMGDRSAGDPLERQGWFFNNFQKLVDDGCWFTPEFRDKLRFTLETADEMDLKLDITMGPGWPPTSPATHGRLAVQALAKGETDVLGGATYSGPVPRAAPGTAAGISIPHAGVQTSADDALVAAVALEVSDASDVTPPVILDPASAVDLSDRIDGGTVTWTAPEPGSRWKLFGFWQRANGGGVPDLFNLDATRALLDDYDGRLFKPLAELLRRNAGDVFEDSPEFGVGPLNIFWTGSFLREFRNRRGYDLTRLLPTLFIPTQHFGPVGSSLRGAPDYDLPGSFGARVRRDYYETLTDLYIDRHVKPIIRWANARGLRSRIQPAYGTSLGIVRSAVAADRADQESLYAGDPGAVYGGPQSRAALDLYREVASGSHIAGRSAILGNELGAALSREQTLTPADYKGFADRSVAGGLTRMLVHGFNLADLDHVPWPGYHAFHGAVAEDWSADHPMLEGMRGMAAYWARTAVATQNGKPRMDLAVIRDDIYVYGDVLQPTPLDGKSLIDKGYTWDLVDSTTLTKHPTFRTRSSMRRRVGYEALIVTSDGRGVVNLNAWSPEAAAHVLELAESGLPVVFLGDLPTRGVSAAVPEQEDARLAAIVKQLLARDNVRQAKSEEQLPDVLAGLGVGPDAATAQDSAILPVHRKTKAGDVFWLMNDSDKAVEVPISFAASGFPSEIDLWDGTTTPVMTYTRAGKRTVVPMRLAPGETRLLVFGPRRPSDVHVTSTDARAVRVEGRNVTFEGGSQATLSNGRRLMLSGAPASRPIELRNWTLSVTPTGPGESGSIDLTLDGLRDWREVPEIADKSGVGVYVASFGAPAEFRARNRAVRLSIGAVAGGSVEAFLNGKRITWRNVPEWDARVEDLLVEGRNELRVFVRTTRNNKVASVAKTNPDPYYQPYRTYASQAYGLLGPVRLWAVPTTSVALPKARSCTRPRRLAIALRLPRGFSAARVVVRVGRATRRVEVTARGRRLRVPIDLRGRPARKTRIRITVTDSEGRVLHFTRAYRLCASPASTASRAVRSAERAAPPGRAARHHPRKLFWLLQRKGPPPRV